jgi:hypothetical protein
VHVTAPHVVAGKVMGPYHHYCKVLSPDPVIECLCYDSDAPGARLDQVEHIVAKSIPRSGAVSLGNWNKNGHDHTQEIATGSVQVLDLLPDKAKEVADLVANGTSAVLSIVFWPPSRGRVTARASPAWPESSTPLVGPARPARPRVGST